MDVLAVIQLAGITLKEKVNLTSNGDLWQFFFSLEVDLKINQQLRSMTKAEKQYLKVFNKVISHHCF